MVPYALEEKLFFSSLPSRNCVVFLPVTDVPEVNPRILLVRLEGGNIENNLNLSLVGQGEACAGQTSDGPAVLPLNGINSSCGSYS